MDDQVIFARLGKEVGTGTYIPFCNAGGGEQPGVQEVLYMVGAHPHITRKLNIQLGAQY